MITRHALLALALLGMTTAVRAGTPCLQSIGTFTAPTFVQHAPGDDTRLYVLERAGRIMLIKDDVRQPEPFLDISALVVATSEGGLLGMAFHPDHATNRRFFVYYTTPGGTGRFVSTLAAYEVSAANPDLAQPASADTILTLDQPGATHNAGWIGFSPVDGYLYLPLGDGGGQFIAGGVRSQDLDQWFGKVLRLNVDGDDFPADPDRDYAVPPDNPFVGVPGADEIWAIGLRNPFRSSFDRSTGDLWIGDVGGGTFEEVNIVPADDPGGRNFGWGCMEGAICFGSDVCTCNDPSLTLPVHDYGHLDGCAITAGALYRGSALPALDGTYFFVDYCTARVWSFRYVNGMVEALTEHTSRLPELSDIVAMGEDAGGELYFVSLAGSIWTLIADPGSCSPAADLNGDGVVSFADVIQLLGAWGPCGAPCPADLDGDGAVAFSDVLVMLGAWTI